MFDSFFNSIFGGLVSSNPEWALVLVALVVTLFVTIIYKWMTDQELLKTLKEDMKALRKEMKDFSKDPEKMKHIQKALADKSIQQMKNTFKPTLVTLLPLLILFGWLRKVYTDIELSFLGMHSWLLIYIIFSVLFSIIIRKILKVH